MAQRSGVSRATVYRLYPGKAALYREVVQTYLPMDEALQMMDTMADQPPNQVMATLARSLAQAGEVRIGVLRSVLFEVSGGPREGNEEFLDEAYLNVQVLIRYLERQMEGGTLPEGRPGSGPAGFPGAGHVPRGVAAGARAVRPPQPFARDAVQELTDGWLRAMAPPRRHRGPEKSQAKAAPTRKKARPSRG